MHSKYFLNTKLIGGAHQNAFVTAPVAKAFEGMIYRMCRHVLMRCSRGVLLKEKRSWGRIKMLPRSLVVSEHGVSAERWSGDQRRVTCSDLL